MTSDSAGANDVEIARFRVVRKETASRIEVEIASTSGVTTGDGKPVNSLMVPLPDGAGDVEVGDEFALVRVPRSAE